MTEAETFLGHAYKITCSPNSYCKAFERLILGSVFVCTAEG
jgi:hypothetical protein